MDLDARPEGQRIMYIRETIHRLALFNNRLWVCWDVCPLRAPNRKFLDTDHRSHGQPRASVPQWWSYC